MFLIELALPFLIFTTRQLRLAAFGGFVLLQIGIALTGNYGYFNLLTIVLCVLLLDDGMLGRAVEPQKLPPGEVPAAVGLAHSIFLGIATVTILLVSVTSLLASLGLKGNWPRPIDAVESFVAPFRSVNIYGLFAVMTTTRPEIIVQGSDDGTEWRDYNFKYKPGNLTRAPRYIAPHQPRLDWQMWFAALGSYQNNPWFVRFCVRLLEGSPPVLELLAENPFPAHPPKFIRALVYDYQFTTAQERRRTGQYWHRKDERIYLPPISLKAPDRER
jgi:lipase maturation factor 1